MGKCRFLGTQKDLSPWQQSRSFLSLFYIWKNKTNSILGMSDLLNGITGYQQEGVRKETSTLTFDLLFSSLSGCFSSSFISLTLQALEMLSFMKTSCFQKFYFPLKDKYIWCSDRNVCRVTYSECQEPPETLETRDSCARRTWSHSWARPSGGNVTLMELWLSQVSTKALSRRKHNVANQISEVKLLGRMLIG